jgi:hypothetical protein
MEELVCPCGDIATNKAEKSVEDDDDRTKSAAVARGKKSKKGECCSHVNFGSLFKRGWS